MWLKKVIPLKTCSIITKYNSEIVFNFAIFKLAQLCILATIFMQSVRHDLKAIFVYQNGLTLTRHIFIMISYLANVPDKIIYAFTVPNRKLFIDENSGYISENASEIRVTNLLKVTATFLLLITTSVSVILYEFSNEDQSYEQISKNMVGFLYFYHFPKTYILSISW